MYNDNKDETKIAKWGFISSFNTFLVKPIVTIFGVFLISSTGAFGQIKCVDAKGKVTYSDVPCATNAVQKSMNLGGAGGQSSQGGASSNSTLDKLVNEQKRLEWVVMGAESDVRMNKGSDAVRKLNNANAELLGVKEQILQIKDPVAYQQYLKEKKEKQRDQQLVDAQRSANEANTRAAEAIQSANNANARAENAAARAGAAEQEAAYARNAAAKAERNAANARGAAEAAQGAAAAAQGAASRPLHCDGHYCY